MAAHHHHPTTACHCHCYCHPPLPPPPPPESHHHHPPPPHLYSTLPHYHQERFQEHYHQERIQEHYHQERIQEQYFEHGPTVNSLLRRIAALETALRRRASPSLRDAAARTIQSHFRAFLVRRSRTLRHLKDLASVKSAFGVLKSSLSESNAGVVYRKAASLLRKLEAIQGGDPLIRNGRISLSREVNKFMDFVDGVCVQRRRGVSAGVRVRYSEDNGKSRGSGGERERCGAKSGDLKRVQAEKLRGLVERIDKLAEELDEEEVEEVMGKTNGDFRVGKPRGLVVRKPGGVQHKVKKNVSFVENGKVYRVLRRHGGPLLEEYCDDSVDMDDSVDDERELEDDLSREIEESKVFLNEDEDDEEIQLENESSSINSDGEKDSRSQLISEGSSGRKGNDKDESDEFVFCAPVPVKMETRGDAMRKKFGDV